ncbi:MAG: hypothetical protein IPH81_12880 [Candidatus Microthrix sp.]|nr:hypothetical protein [Candidatus Microthrix sp.]
MRTDIAAVKFTMAKVLREVSFNAPAHPRFARHDQPHPAAGDGRHRTDDGHRRWVDEVHKATVARNVLKGY